MVQELEQGLKALNQETLQEHPMKLELMECWQQVQVVVVEEAYGPLNY